MFMLQETCNYCGYPDIYQFNKDDPIELKYAITIGFAIAYAIVFALGGLITFFIYSFIVSYIPQRIKKFLHCS